MRTALLLVLAIALAAELARAERAGFAAGREHGVHFNAMPAGDVARFLRIYDAHAERGARGARRFGIDGVKSYPYARRLAARAATSGDVVCKGA